MNVTRLVLATVLAGALVCPTTRAETPAPTVTCKDGTSSPGGRGACRGHGGVDKTKTAGGAPAAAAAPAATVTCKDGATSPGGRGACRGHGGVDKAKTAGAAPQATPPPAAAAPAAAAPAARPAPSPTAAARPAGRGKAATDDPAGALAKCKDGMYWHGAKHSGACSHHGGVDSWLDGTEKK